MENNFYIARGSEQGKELCKRLCEITGAEDVILRDVAEFLFGSNIDIEWKQRDSDNVEDSYIGLTKVCSRITGDGDGVMISIPQEVFEFMDFFRIATEVKATEEQEKKAEEIGKRIFGW